jgi:hypothetical protein
MHANHATPSRTWHRLTLLATSLALATPLWAQQPAADAATPAPTSAEPGVQTVEEQSASAQNDEVLTTEALQPQALPMGQATRGLLQRQREGSVAASADPQSLDGPMVDSARQRYLKSFEQPLPVWFGRQVKTPAN